MTSETSYCPEDVSLSGYHQVVTATGESSLLYGNKQQPIIIDSDDEDVDFPAKKIVTDGVRKGGYIKPSKFNPAEIDVTQGIISPSLVSLKGNKKQLSDKENLEIIKTKISDGKEKEKWIYEKQEGIQVIEIENENTVGNLNIQLRDPVSSAWNEAIIKSGKVTRADNSRFPESVALFEDNFRDFGHLDSRIYDDFVKGYVVMGSNRGVSSLLNASSSLTLGTHGVIVERTLIPSFEGLYEEGDCQQYTVERELGKGTFGTVSYCRHRDGHPYVKKVVQDKFNKKEVEVLMQLSHPNITTFYGYIVREGQHEIMMQYGGDSLKTLMDKISPRIQDVLTYDLVKKFSLQGFSALHYMYEHFGILHLDIKPENICVMVNEGILKITDFGTSKTPQQAVSFDGWTPEYMSPEACRLLMSQKMSNLSAEDLTGKTDVYAFALVICFMLTGNHTVCKFWPKFTKEYTFTMWRSQFIVHMAQNSNFMQKVAVQDDWPKEMRDLLTSALEGDTNNRITAAEACNYIQQYMLYNQANIPFLLSPGSPASSVPSELSTMASVAMEMPPSPEDQEFSKQNIKKQLRRKIRRKSAAPYQRQPSIAKPEAVVENKESALPDFAELF